MTLPSLSEIQDAAKVIYKVMQPTPELVWPLLSEFSGAEVWVKHENFTPIGAFKLRGGLTYLDFISKNPEIKKIITATRGNHGQSIAFSATLYGIEAEIIVPNGNSSIKNSAIKNYGAKLIEHGKDFQDALEYAESKAKQTNIHLIPSYHRLLVAGVATYALEFFIAAKNLDTIYVPIGLGSGICGVISVRDAMGLKTRIVGVVSKNAPAYANSFKSKRMVSTKHADTIADGLACRMPNAEAFEHIMAGVERIITVSETDIINAIGTYFSYTKNVAEGAAAAALAALLQEKPRIKGKKIGLILSGSNIEPNLYKNSLNLLNS
ncbi:MAG: hypothetical protein CMM30_05635 [Rhodospirillaceae bacterium]|nr:hypothetical protein [Rhodospirillaceae bacterium]|tara:strand:+ start:352 stop:1317 length:966 start_codon:yes stop_codon:yes gene_type:complete